MDVAAQLEALAAQDQRIQQQQRDLISQLIAEKAQLQARLDAQAGTSTSVAQPEKCQKPAQHDARLRQEYKRLRDAHVQLQAEHGALQSQHAQLEAQYAKDSGKWQVFNEWWSAKVNERDRKVQARRQSRAAAIADAVAPPAPVPAAGNAASSNRRTKQHLTLEERAICESVGLHLEVAGGGSKKKSSRGTKRPAPPETPTPAAPPKRSRGAVESAAKAGPAAVLQERINAHVVEASPAAQDVSIDEADVSGVKHAGSPAPMASDTSSTVTSKDAGAAPAAMPAPAAAQFAAAGKASDKAAPEVMRDASPEPAPREVAAKEPKTPGPLTQDRMDLESRVQALRLARSNRKQQEALSPTKSVTSPTKPAPAPAAAAASPVKAKLPNTPAVPDAGPSRKKTPAATSKSAIKSDLLQKLRTPQGGEAADTSEDLSLEERKRRRRERNRLAAEELAKDPNKYKGHGRYAREHEGVGNRTINSEYEIDPDRNGGVAFPHKDVVRNKAERKQMHAHDCPCCSEWYAAVGYPNDKDGQAHKQATSRHRAYGPPASTPPHYWQIAFPESPEAREINRKAEIEHEKRRQQMDHDPRYKKRGEGSRR